MGRLQPAFTLLTLVMFMSLNVYAQQTTQPSAGWTQEMSAGVAALGQDRFTDAEESFKAAIERVKDEEENPRLPAAMNNLGTLYHRQGRHTEAEALHKRALELRENVFGKEHPDVAQSLNNLATVYVEQRRYSEAIPLYERAIVIWEKTRGKDYYKIAAALGNLATVAEVQGRYSRARQLYDQSLALWEKNRGENDLLYAQSLENYAGLLRRINDQAGSAAALSQASEIRAEAARARAQSAQTN